MTKKTVYNARGTARFPWLNRPDTKFKEEGEFKLDLVVPADVAAPHLARANALLAATMAQGKIDRKGKPVKESDYPPIAPTLDEDGNETGEYTIKLRMKASGVSKKTGKAWSRKVPLFDCSQPPKAVNVQIGGGSVLIAAWNEDGWMNPKGECGVKLYLEAVQVVEVRAGQSSGAGFGFGAEEGGLTADSLGEDDAPESVGEAAGGANGYDFS